MCENQQICIYMYTFDSYTPTGWHVRIQYHQVTCSQPPTRNLFLPGAALNVRHAFATCGTVKKNETSQDDQLANYGWFIWLTIWHAGNRAQFYSWNMLGLIVYVHANIPFVMYIYSRDQNMYTVPCIYLYIIFNACHCYPVCRIEPPSTVQNWTHGDWKMTEIWWFYLKPAMEKRGLQLWMYVSLMRFGCKHYTQFKTNMTMDNSNHLKMYLLLKLVMSQYHFHGRQGTWMLHFVGEQVLSLLPAVSRQFTRTNKPAKRN